MGRISSAAGCALVAGAAWAGVAGGQALGANSIVSIDVGQPKAEIATTATARVITDAASNRLYVRYRPAGGPACAPVPNSDPGTRLSGLDFSFLASGDQTVSGVVTFPKPGSYQLCAWIYETVGADSLVAQFSGSFSVASPLGAITGTSVAPSPARPGQPVAVSVSGNSEVNRNLVVSWRPAGEPACAASPGLEPSSSSGDSSRPYRAASVLGNFSERVQLTLSRPGRYRFCSWVASDGDDLSPLGVNETTIIVLAPRPALTTRLRGRTLIARVRAPAAGRLRATLIGRGKRIVIGTRTLASARTVSLSYRRARGVRAGRYRLVVTFRPDSGQTVTVRRTVRLR